MYKGIILFAILIVLPSCGQSQISTKPAEFKYPERYSILAEDMGASEEQAREAWAKYPFKSIRMEIVSSSIIIFNKTGRASLEVTGNGEESPGGLAKGKYVADINVYSYGSLCHTIEYFNVTNLKQDNGLGVWDGYSVILKITDVKTGEEMVFSDPDFKGPPELRAVWVLMFYFADEMEWKKVDK